MTDLWKLYVNTQYSVRVQHDKGRATLRVNGQHGEHAASRVRVIEGCPPSAILSVRAVAGSTRSYHYPTESWVKAATAAR